ncbi:MAG: hypothetical protein AAB553_02030 [Patescibacteria group bacterium]
MNTTEQELLRKLLETLSAWNKDLQQVRNDYKQSIIVIDKARLALENQAKSRWQIGLSYAPWIILLLVLIVIIVAIFTFRCGTISFQDIRYVIPCTSGK